MKWASPAVRPTRSCLWNAAKSSRMRRARSSLGVPSMNVLAASSIKSSIERPAVQSTMTTPSPDVDRLKRDLAAFVGFDTQNPPGREIELAGFLRDLLAAEGFDVKLQEYQAGRVNL